MLWVCELWHLATFRPVGREERNDLIVFADRKGQAFLARCRWIVTRGDQRLEPSGVLRSILTNGGQADFALLRKRLCEKDQVIDQYGGYGIYHRITCTGKTPY